MVSIRPSDAKLRYVGNGIFMKGVEVEPDDTFRFNCLRCGYCCSHPPGVNPNEASRIAQYLGIKRGELFKKYLTLHEDDSYGWKAKIDKIGDNCAFYSKEKGKASCRINPVKPRQCRAKPVSRLGSKMIAEGVVPDLMFEPCRGFGRGKEYTVMEWITENKLEQAWDEETEYALKVMMMKREISSNQLKEKIAKMFEDEV
jgi:Fe-S-cluster containining protein